MQRNSLQLDGGRVDFMWLVRMRTFWTCAPHHIQGQHVQDTVISYVPWRLYGQACFKSHLATRLSPIHMIFSKIDSHGRSWLTNLCSKPSQSERGGEPRRQTFPANLNCSGDRRQRLTSLAADQAHFQPWLNKAWAKKTSVTQLHDAESSRDRDVDRT